MLGPPRTANVAAARCNPRPTSGAATVSTIQRRKREEKKPMGMAYPEQRASTMVKRAT